MVNDFLSARTAYWASTLTAIPSETGSPDEARFAGELVALLGASPAFASNPDDVWTIDVAGGAHARRCVLALVRGSGRRTVVLTGHFDVVETGCYGALEPLALRPDALAPALIERLSQEPADPRNILALDDLKSGDFLPGRGLLDMKGGLAAGLAVIEWIVREPFDGNLLFIAVPDEEGNSAGARAISQRIGKIAGERDLDIEAVLNLDATVDEGDGEAARVVALGSVGKLLPSAFVVGRPGHAATSFRGFGAAALAGALAAEVVWSADLTERSGPELGAGPTLLGMKDNKTAYDVTMPASVWMYWNVMTHRRSPDDVLQQVEAAARRCSSRLVADLAQRASERNADVSLRDVEIIRFQALHEEVARRSPDDIALLAAFCQNLGASDLSLPEQCRQATEELWRLSGRSGPAIVLGFASIPYLPVELRDDPLSSRLAAAVERAIAGVSEQFQTTIGTIRYFPGISDVSFFGQADERHVATIAANTPAWSAILAGEEQFGAAGLPSINVGPWGRDYHTRLERTHVRYAFEVLPALILSIVDNLR